MIDNTMHDEIKYLGTKIIIDTAFLGANYDRPFETMALRKNGQDIECVRSATLEDARRVHRLMLERYAEHPDAPLSGKYAKLRDDLIAAYAETEYLEQTEDGGTCNFDSPTVKLPRWNGKKIEQAAKEAGGGAWKWELWGSARWVFSFPTSGQANRRSYRAEAISAAMKAKGYDAGMYCQAD